MCWITTTLIMLTLGFACAFALSEWIVTRRGSRQDRDPRG